MVILYTIINYRISKILQVQVSIYKGSVMGGEMGRVIKGGSCDGKGGGRVWQVTVTCLRATLTFMA